MENTKTQTSPEVADIPCRDLLAAKNLMKDAEKDLTERVEAAVTDICAEWQVRWGAEKILPNVELKTLPRPVYGGLPNRVAAHAVVSIG